MEKNNKVDNGSFVLLSLVENSAPPRLRLLVPAMVIVVGMLATYISGLVSLLVSSLAASILMVCLGILSEQEARDAVKWDFYVGIASAFGIGTAMINTGIDHAIADFLVDIGEGLNIGEAGIVGVVYCVTSFLANNCAAAVLLFPITINAAEDAGVNRAIMAYTIGSFCVHHVAV